MPRRRQMAETLAIPLVSDPISEGRDGAERERGRAPRGSPPPPTSALPPDLGAARPGSDDQWIVTPAAIGM